MGERKLTKAQRAALEMLPWEFNREISEERLRADGVGRATLQSLYASDLARSSRYANGTFWAITDAGRSALEASNG